MNIYSAKKGTCELCGRTACLFKHHLKPKRSEETCWLCIDCHHQIHAFFSTKQLRNRYYTLDSLKNNTLVNNYIKWVRKRKIMGLHPSMKR